MCGILACIYNDKNKNNEKSKSTTNIVVLKNRQYYINLSKRVRHRGPDWSGIYFDNLKHIAICHERLSIVGIDSGSQPIINDELGIVLSVNGEIYNHKQLYDLVLHNKYTPNGKSDCEVIIYLYKEFGFNFVKMLDGIFSFVLYDKQKDLVFVARDSIGIIPLYHGMDTTNNCYFVGSELKTIQDDCDIINVFPPGHYLVNYRNNDIKLGDVTRYYNPLYLNNTFKTYNEESIKETIKNSLISSVNKRLMADVPYGVLLSGGLDSSLIASITNNIIQEDGGGIWGNKIHSFSIGLKNAPDLIYAKKVADYLGTIHHEINFTVQDGIDCISDLIYHLETYDVTTIRASTPMFLLSRIIKSMGIKMVLSGEGADEIFGGYLYFHNAPNDQQFHEECIDRVNNLHHFDCLRANKSTMSWGVEARVPFLDKSFIENVIKIQPSLKLNKEKKIEKYILRSAFDCLGSNGEKYLPDEILWRQKEQFSDGVGYDWIDGLKEFCDSNISDEEMSNRSKFYMNDIPKTKEALYYRKIFDKLFPKSENIVPRWVPRTDWEGVSYDPSGRAQKVHVKTNVN